MSALDTLRESLPAAARDDARAAAALMGMNSVFYRSRHMLGGDYESRPARLRMQRIVKPAGPTVDFELAVSAIKGCDVCLRAHEKTVTEAGLSPDAVLDALRIAAVLHGVACALEAGG